MSSRVALARASAAAGTRVGERITNVNAGARQLDILFLTNAHNSMSQRAWLELTQLNHKVTVELALDRAQMVEVVEKHKPELIVAPFLTKHVDEKIFSNYPTLIVHPGIHGDRGASSIDWALQKGVKEWGVTVMLASEEMDGGDIYSSVNYSTKRTVRTGALTKSSMYGNEAVNAAMVALLEALHKYIDGIPPTPLDYSDPACKGTLMPNMVQRDRAVDWTLSALEVVQRISSADGSPGCLDSVGGVPVFLYGAHVETDLNKDGRHAPRDLIATREEAVCIATGHNGAVWVTHLKRKRQQDSTEHFIKLTAARVLPDVINRLPENIPNLLDVHDPLASWREIWIERDDASEVCYIFFDFHNGAMNTEQCQRLVAAIEEVKKLENFKVLVFMGGYDYFSNGVHLNTIQAATDPAEESWRNINAINDVVLAMMDCPNHLTISVMRGKAGAGGVMAALGADYVYCHESTVLNPHYKAMGLYGSEYWTYNLPRRCGHKAAEDMTEGCLPISGKQALELGVVDALLGRDVEACDQEVRQRAVELASKQDFKELLQNKQKRFTPEWRAEIAKCRESELAKMKKCFVSDAYVQAREAFVLKKGATTTPWNIAEANANAKNLFLSSASYECLVAGA